MVCCETGNELEGLVMDSGSNTEFMMCRNRSGLRFKRVGPLDGHIPNKRHST